MFGLMPVLWSGGGMGGSYKFSGGFHHCLFLVMETGRFSLLIISFYEFCYIDGSSLYIGTLGGGNFSFITGCKCHSDEFCSDAYTGLRWMVLLLEWFRFSSLDDLWRPLLLSIGSGGGFSAFIYSFRWRLRSSYLPLWLSASHLFSLSEPLSDMEEVEITVLGGGCCEFLLSDWWRRWSFWVHCTFWEGSGILPAGCWSPGDHWEGRMVSPTWNLCWSVPPSGWLMGGKKVG